jgi:anthranilate synthase/aminodeoxychorismate synthase-like glutamine amidotransferase
LLLIKGTFSQMHILLFDNHDSFTWNLSHDLERAGADVMVARAEELPVGEKEQRAFLSQFVAVVLSPGAGMPAEAPMLMAVLDFCVKNKKPVLGVCLGFQAIVEYFGGELENMREVLHGRVGRMILSEQYETKNGLFENVQFPCEVAHYHSWVAKEEALPQVLMVEARTEQGMILALRHKSLPISGFQFHPESVLTPDGRVMLSNWLNALKREALTTDVLPFQR